MAGSTGNTTRASKAKVRTGCITCNCISTGRVCDGYTSAPKPAASLSETRRLAAGEARAQEFFNIKSVPEMLGFFVRPFWDAVLQFGLTEPLIKHAITALATAHEVYSTPLLLATHRSDGMKFAIQSYNRAIAARRKRASDADSMPLMALASIIFVYSTKRQPFNLKGWNSFPEAAYSSNLFET
ncbi:unnamed protein product [Clonostachys rhizophaga]|uniref:Uncharacterized protein n=1 Tax=Clonostachys rhizophaga TaxID=160324 RepID=A0A9N9VAB3_9HYPO|nr:unnamed protein product [Clonostachys rhizophaga]